MKGNSQSSNNPSIGKGKKGQDRMETKEGTRILMIGKEIGWNE